MYKVKQSDLKGQIKDFPIEVVQKMVEKQVHQGRKRDVRIFQIKPDDCPEGFQWSRTIEGDSFWRNIIYQADFDLFFKKYPKKEEKKDDYKLSKELKNKIKNDANKVANKMVDDITHSLEYRADLDTGDDDKNRPPLGVMPKFIWDCKRTAMLKEAIKRYLDADKAISVDWIAEYNELVRGKK